MSTEDDQTLTTAVSNVHSINIYSKYRNIYNNDIKNYSVSEYEQ